MNIGELKDWLSMCDDGSDVVIFALTENDNYRPFRNILASISDKGSFNEELHLDISIHREFKNVHFKDNLTEEEVEDLLDKRVMLMEELDELDGLLQDYL